MEVQTKIQTTTMSMTLRNLSPFGAFFSFSFLFSPFSDIQATLQLYVTDDIYVPNQQQRQISSIFTQKNPVLLISQILVHPHSIPLSHANNRFPYPRPPPPLGQASGPQLKTGPPALSCCENIYLWSHTTPSLLCNNNIVLQVLHYILFYHICR